MKSKYIGIDFDGTVVTHDFPDTGKDIGAEPVLRDLVDAGHKLILNTMRSDRNDGTTPLQDAVQWFVDRKIPLYGINWNPDQACWTSSPKVYAHLYIDDAALGCPLRFDPKKSDRPFVCWDSVRNLLIGAGYLGDQTTKESNK